MMKAGCVFTAAMQFLFLLGQSSYHTAGHFQFLFIDFQHRIHQTRDSEFRITYISRHVRQCGDAGSQFKYACESYLVAARFPFPIYE